MKKSETKEKRTFDEIYALVGKELKTLFISLNLAQVTFINYCKFNARILFIENNRFADEEQGHSDTYKIEVALKKVLAIEYLDDLSFLCKQGSTETFHGVIALPQEGKALIDAVNETKAEIGNILTETVDSRTKVDGQWQPINKELLRAIGFPRANVKQIRRRLNVHSDVYHRISLSGTEQRPIYRKGYETILGLLKNFSSESARFDEQVLEQHKHLEEFALFHDKHYVSMDGNFKYKIPVDAVTKKGKHYKKSILTQKISSPIYILCDGPVKDLKLEIKYKTRKDRNTKRETTSRVINDKPLLTTLPVYTYR